jgi:large subunit ribosomal protein L15
MSMLHEITTGLPRNTKRTRKGRGRSSGHGKTSGRGTKGSKARVGTYIKPSYEGGQTEVFRRFPKRGFSNYNFERKFHIVNLSSLELFDAGATVDAPALKEKGLISDLKMPVKILADGEFSKKLTIVAGWYSKSAYDKITAAGGTAQNALGQPFEFPKPKKKFIPRDDAPKKGGKKSKADEAEEPTPAAAPAATDATEAPKEA